MLYWLLYAETKLDNKKPNVRYQQRHPQISDEAFIKAAEDGKNDAVLAYLKQKNANLEITDQNGFTALIKAVSNWKVSTIILLLEHGANINVQAKDGRTPLMFMAGPDGDDNHEKIVKLLLNKNPNLNLQDKLGQTILMKVSGYWPKTLQRELIKHNADVNVKDHNGKTALMCAAEVGDANFVELLLEKNVDINAQDSKGRTALIYAAAEGDYPELPYAKAVEVLLRHGAGVHFKDKAGKTARDIARRKEIIEMLTKVSSKKS